ncbi:MAG: outer membrane beta-barrel protein, partial [Candidatus Omnitrophica bacterium]|nr:outer membrane beta-barrel protein [Candidatus Omnitrophota bacterium]
MLLSLRNAIAFDVSEIEITPQISVSETYDDNISYASAHEQADFITMISPGISAAYDAKDFRWDMYADITQQMFASYDEHDNTAENLKFNASAELSKQDRVSLSEKFSHTYEPVSFDEAFGRTLGRYSYYTNSIVVEYIRDINSQCSARVSYGYQTDQFSKRTSADSFMNTAAARFDYALSSRITLFMLDEFSKR